MEDNNPIQKKARIKSNSRQPNKVNRKNKFKIRMKMINQKNKRSKFFALTPSKRCSNAEKSLIKIK